MKKAIFTTILIFLGATGASANEAASSSPPKNRSDGEAVLSSLLKDRSIGYVLANEQWAVYTTKEASECPQGFNLGPREQYDALFPKGGTTRKVVDTELVIQKSIWFPNESSEPFEFKEAVSKIAPGLNLDGKVGPNDFTSPDSETGIDNQLYRVVGCVVGHRDGGQYYHLGNDFMQMFNFARVVIELTDVDSLVNDDDVTVTKYRGLDQMLTDSTGKEILPHGTQNIDTRWGKKFISRAHGKITNGVLTTEPMDIYFPIVSAMQDFSAYRIRGSRLKLNLTPEEATGLWGGYVDIWSWNRSMITASGTHTLAGGKAAAQSMYKAALRLADGYPDPKTGRNTAISAAKDVRFKQVYVVHPNKKVVSENENSGSQNAALR